MGSLCSKAEFLFLNVLIGVGDIECPSQDSQVGFCQILAFVSNLCVKYTSTDIETEINYIDINGVYCIGDVKYFGGCLWL